LLLGPIAVKLTFKFEKREKSRKRKLDHESSHSLYKTNKPGKLYDYCVYLLLSDTNRSIFSLTIDLDNMSKFVLDAMNKVIFDDDAQVVRLECEKVYADESGTDIEVKAITILQ
jgi:Holliday junction resolvase RusA-like endonuclease